MANCMYQLGQRDTLLFSQIIFWIFLWALKLVVEWSKQITSMVSEPLQSVNGLNRTKWLSLSQVRIFPHHVKLGHQFIFSYFATQTKNTSLSLLSGSLTFDRYWNVPGFMIKYAGPSSTQPTNLFHYDIHAISIFLKEPWRIDPSSSPATTWEFVFLIRSS